MSAKIERPDPPYMQVAAQIRDQITSGRLREGDRVPSAREIVRDWQISLATATKALAALRSEGLVQGVAGVGTIVSGAPRPTPRDHISSTFRTGRIYPPGDHAKITSVGLIPAPGDVADALGVKAGAMVIRRRRVTYRGDDPVGASTSWFDGHLAERAPRLVQRRRLPQGTPAYIQEATGRRVVSGRDQITARTASREEANELSIEPGTVVMEGRNWYYDLAGEVIEYGEYIGPGDRMLTYDYRAD